MKSLLLASLPLAARTAQGPFGPFRNRDACRIYADGARQRLEQRLAEERAVHDP